MFYAKGSLALLHIIPCRIFPHVSRAIPHRNNQRMKQFLTLLWLAMLPVLTLSRQTINASIQHDGMTRDYILYVPAIYDVNTPVALLFNFHGYSRNATL
jgi:poly(3-hydroxybutyrate) depolymerase